MPGTIRGFLQGLAYSLPKISEIMVEDRMMTMNNEQLENEKRRIELEKSRYDLDERMFEEVTLPQSKQQSRLADLQIENAANVLDSYEKFGKKTEELQYKMSWLDYLTKSQAAPLEIEKLQNEIKRGTEELKLIAQQSADISFDRKQRELQYKQTYMMNSVLLARAAAGIPAEILDSLLDGESLVANVEKIMSDPKVSRDAKDALLGIREPLYQIEADSFTYETNIINSMVEARGGEVSEKDLERITVYARRVAGERAEYLKSIIRGTQTEDLNMQKELEAQRQREEAERLRKQQAQGFKLGNLLNQTKQVAGFAKEAAPYAAAYGISKLPGIKYTKNMYGLEE